VAVLTPCDGADSTPGGAVRQGFYCVDRGGSARAPPKARVNLNIWLSRAFDDAPKRICQSERKRLLPISLSIHRTHPSVDGLKVKSGDNEITS
jgi:hypothetical protein